MPYIDNRAGGVSPVLEESKNQLNPNDISAKFGVSEEEGGLENFNTERIVEYGLEVDDD
jgi:hypothetical protein